LVCIAVFAAFTIFGKRGNLGLYDMKKYLLSIIFFSALLVMLPLDAKAGLADRLAGRILLNVEANGEAWYVYPEDMRRYYLGRPKDAFSIMRELGLGITDVNLQRIAQSDMPVDGDLALARKLSGRIVLQVEENGEAWYINPEDLKRYYLGRPADAFSIMRELGLGITRENLARVHKPGLEESIDEYSSYEHIKITTKKGDTFTVDLVEIDLNDPNLEIITDTAQSADCEHNCQAKSLGDYVFEYNAFAGMNGTYFDTGAGKLNYYFFPVYNTEQEVFINEDQLKYWTTGPIMAFDEDNNFYYFKDSREFKSVEYFEETHAVELQAAIGCKPRIIEEGLNYLIDWEVDDKQRYVKSIRNAVGYKDETFYLLTMRNATIEDLADVLKTLKVEYALNMDGGSSSALFYNDEYMVGPGRDVPNVILFRKRN
jgi:exopolysaccharide biosynthesis protein